MADISLIAKHFCVDLVGGMAACLGFLGDVRIVISNTCVVMARTSREMERFTFQFVDIISLM